jgi:hypothetical protein
MNQNLFRRIARLEKLAKPYLDARQRAEKKWVMTFYEAAAHAAILAFLIRYGNPIVGEPLSTACQRVSESPAWTKFSEEFRHCLPRSDKQHLFVPYNEPCEEPYNSPFKRTRALLIGPPLRHAVLSNFVGADEKEKLEAVFASAPPWLIWFTFADYTAKLLSLALPDFSHETRFARSQENLELWPGLPSGAFEPSRWPNGSKNEPLARTDLSLLRPVPQLPDSPMTPREQKRARATYMKARPIERTDSWPRLLKAELFKLTPHERNEWLRNRNPKDHSA